MIHLQHVYKTYPGPVHALRDINLKVEKGEFVFITGASGAGKTTLFKMLSGFDLPSSGNIHVLEHNLAHIKNTELPFLRRKIGVVFQDFKLLLDRSVIENIALPLQIMGESQAKIRFMVEEALREVGLADKGDVVASCLSGGEQQRVAIARAIIHQPDIIIADEPTGNLDPKLSWEIMEIFNKANQRGMTVIIATHDYAFFEKYNKRRIHIVKGEIEDSSATDITKDLR